MTNPAIEEIFSVINGHVFAKDKDRVFTYIEFVKMFGYDNDPNTFITFYKDYVSRWANLKKSEINITDEEFVASKLIEILKSITLDYSSYEEQDFIAHINLNNKAHLKALSALYSRKIREITEFYRKKRNESVLVVNRNSIKGSKKSIQEIIYEKVFDFIFSNKNIVPSYKNIKRDLLVTVEQYVDTYSEYFDIPRTYEFTDETRRDMLTANMNDVDYRMYLEIELVVSELLFSGNVMLEEIPLIAQLGLDLSQSCVGDMLALKNSLVANTTINQVDLNEQIALKRKLYEKFIGTDLWYLYVDLQGNIKLDILCKAKNPTGNLLNCGNPDTATIASEQEELLSHIGLFFKPDKTSILKINAKDYTWSVDADNLITDTVYIFPDPNKYGDIGNNKDQRYPLIMEYKLDWDIRNISSGASVDDPLLFVTDQGWRTYYSKQDDIFKQIKNTNWEYSFTFLANKGFLSNYQKDIWGNEWGLLKGSSVSYVTKTFIDKNGDEVTKEVPKLTLTGNGFKNEMIFGENEENIATPKIINGGYFENPLYPGYKGVDKNGNSIWLYNGSEDKVQPFNYDKRLILNDHYMWSGIEVYGIPQTKEQIEFSPSQFDNNYINFGEFGRHNGILYEDHFGVVPSNYVDVVGDDKIIIDVLQQFFSVNLLENPQYSDFEYEVKDASYEEIQSMNGDLYIKLIGDIDAKPIKIQKEMFESNADHAQFTWWNDDLQIKDFWVFYDNLIIETDDAIRFIPYKYDGQNILPNIGMRELLELSKNGYLNTKVLFNEQERMFYILQLQEWKPVDNRIFILPKITKFNPKTYTIEEKINFFDLVYKTDYENGGLNRIVLWQDYLQTKKEIIYDGSKLWNERTKYENILDFEIPQYDNNKLGQIGFTYNSALGTYLISFVVIDENGTPYIYEFKFKMTSVEDFESSLKTNVYTLKTIENDTDVYWTKNSTISCDTRSSYPYNDSLENIFKIENYSTIPDIS